MYKEELDELLLSRTWSALDSSLKQKMFVCNGLDKSRLGQAAVGHWDNASINGIDLFVQCMYVFFTC